MKYFLKLALIIFCLSINISSANAKWISVEELCEMGEKWSCQKLGTFIERGYMRLPVIYGIMRAVDVTSSGRFVNWRFYITRADKKYRHLCDGYVDATKSEWEDSESVYTMFSVTRC